MNGSAIAKSMQKRYYESREQRFKTQFLAGIVIFSIAFIVKSIHWIVTQLF